MNTKKSFAEKENQAIERWTSFKLPNKVKPLGWCIAIGCFISFLWLAKMADVSFLILYTLKTVGVIGLAMVVLAKEKVEDEMKDVLRGKAMLFSFISALLFMIITPYVTTMIIALVSDNYEQVAIEISHFNMLSCIMLMYILGLKTMKRLYQ
jgi:hypothetical protein